MYVIAVHIECTAMWWVVHAVSMVCSVVAHAVCMVCIVVAHAVCMVCTTLWWWV